MKRLTSWWKASCGESRTRVWLVVLALVSCTTRETRPAASASVSKRVTLFFSAEVRGYLGPCGCSESMRGGISRAAFQIAQARRGPGPVYFVDVGDGLFGEARLPQDAVPQQERKATALAQAWKAMGLSFRTGGPLDDVRGPAFRDALKLPELRAGTFEVRDGVGFVNAVTPQVARELALKARGAGARWVVASVPYPFDQLVREAPEASEVDLFVAAQAKDAFSAEESRLAGGKTKVAQVQSKGRSLLRVDVSFQGEGPVEWLRGDQEKERELGGLDQRIELLRAQLNEPMLGDELKALRKAKLEDLIGRRELLASAPAPMAEGRNSVTARFVPLESNFPKEPAVEAIEKSYDVEVGLLNLKWAQEHAVPCPAPTADHPGIAGTALCLTCHAAAEPAWKNTKHPGAYTALVEVGKQNHLDCVGCHVTGWRQPSGVCRIDQTEGRQEVGCESCHGAGAAHSKQPTKANISRASDAKACVGCHDSENSPHFDYQRYVEKVLGPGHGQPK